jgi:tyrosinase
MKVVMRPNQSAVGTHYDFVRAVLNLKAAKSERGEPNITNLYDEFVVDHLRTVHIQPDRSDLNDAHNGPAFFPWHRQFLINFEQALQKVSGNPLLGLPYWDWSVDQSEAPYPQPSWPFTPWFLGGDGSSDPRVLGKVLDGEFAYDARKDGDPKKWVLNVRTGEEPTPWLSRRFGAGNLSLPAPADVQAALSATPYDVDPYDSSSTSGFRNMAEGFIPFGMHNLVHVYVSGSMVPMTSPNDPVFFLHHCFVDKLWAEWQLRHQDDVGYQPYLPTHGARQGHNLTDPMPPWKQKRPADVLNHRNLGHRYDTEPYLLEGEELYQGQWIWSANKKYSLLYGDQERVLWLEPTSGGKTIWQSDTTNQPPGRLYMREDGNVVIYHIDAPGPQGRGNPYESNPIWESNTAGNPGCYLWVSDEGYLELYWPGDNTPFWRKPGS